MDVKAIGHHINPAGVHKGLHHFAHVELAVLAAAVQVSAQDFEVCILDQPGLIGVLHAPEPQEVQDAEGFKLGTPDGTV